ncbi:MAG: PQQ-binding-like beta-propeller repeat protein [Bacteroidales bacterium]
MRKLFLILTGAVLLSSCSEKFSNQYRNNQLNTGVYQSLSVKKNPSELWKFKTGGEIYASVTYDHNNIYVGSGDQNFYSLNAKTGNLNWKFETDGAIYSTAALKDQFVYFLSYDGFLYKLNKKSGKQVWQFETTGDQKHLIKNYYNPDEMVEDFWDFYQSSPTIYSNTIYFGAGEKFYAVDLDTGKEKWHFKTEGAVHSSPAIKDNKVYFGSFDGRVYCLDMQTGTEIWQFETGQDTEQYVWLGVQASPAIEDEKLYIGSRDASIYCIDINSGDTIWTNDNFNRSWMPSSFAIGKNLYCGSSDGFCFYVIDKSTGKIIKTIDTHSYTFSSPAINQQMAYVGSANGRLYGINLKSQSIDWEYKSKTVKDDTLGIYNKKGVMNKEKLRDLMIKLDVTNYSNMVKMYEHLFESSGAILSSPVISNETIFYGSADGYIYALSEK